MNNRKIGHEKELLAAQYLTAHGMVIVASNFRVSCGEIDLIGYHKGYLVFVEVKYRKNADKGSALQAVGYAKQRQICKVADYYRCKKHMGSQTMIRYDVVAIQGETIEWIQDAFPHVYHR